MYKAVLDEVDQVAVKMLPSEQFSKSQLEAFFNEVPSPDPSMQGLRTALCTAFRLNRACYADSRLAHDVRGFLAQC